MVSNYISVSQGPVLNIHTAEEGTKEYTSLLSQAAAVSSTRAYPSFALKISSSPSSLRVSQSVP